MGKELDQDEERLSAARKYQLEASQNVTRAFFEGYELGTKYARQIFKEAFDENKSSTTGI